MAGAISYYRRPLPLSGNNCFEQSLSLVEFKFSNTHSPASFLPAWLNGWTLSARRGYFVPPSHSLHPLGHTPSQPPLMCRPEPFQAFFQSVTGSLHTIKDFIGFLISKPTQFIISFSSQNLDSDIQIVFHLMFFQDAQISLP